MTTLNTETAPVDPGVGAPGGCRSNPAHHVSREVYSMMPDSLHEYRCTHCGDDQTVACDRAPKLTLCGHCTVPVTGSDVCSFCADCQPRTVAAALPLEQVENLVRCARDELHTVLHELADNAPLFAVVDAAEALEHLYQAAALIRSAMLTGARAEAEQVAR